MDAVKWVQEGRGEKNVYRMGRSGGTFQGVLSLPDDADQEGVVATSKNGVLRTPFSKEGCKMTESKALQVKEKQEMAADNQPREDRSGLGSQAR